MSVHLVLRNSDDVTSGNQPHVVVSFTGDPPQVCFQTTAAAACTATSVTDTANGTDATGTFTSGTVRLAVAPGAACQPNVVVDKEICASDDNVDCGPGGAGPWVKQTPAGLLGLLLAHPRRHVDPGVTAAVDEHRVGDVPASRLAAGHRPDHVGEFVRCRLFAALRAARLTHTASTAVPWGRGSARHRRSNTNVQWQLRLVPDDSCR